MSDVRRRRAHPNLPAGVVEEVQRLARLHPEWTHAELAELVDASRKTVQKIRVAMPGHDELACRSTRPQREVRDRVLAVLAENGSGITVLELSRRAGVSEPAARRNHKAVGL